MAQILIHLQTFWAQAQRNELNTKVRATREELQLLQEQASYVGEVVKPLDKKKVLIKINPEGKFIVDIDKDIKIEDCTRLSDTTCLLYTSPSPRD